jgi:O-antigen/teichoic acid export membrane protein
MGTIKRQGLKNAVFTYLGVAVGFLNLIVLLPFVLSAEQLGLLRIMYSATILFGTLYPIGLNFLTIRFFPGIRNEENKHNGYLGFLLLISLSGFLFLSAFVYLFQSNIISYYQQKSKLFVDYFHYVIPIGFLIGTTTILTGYLNALFKSTVPTFLNEVFIRVWMTVIALLYYFSIITFSQLMLLYLGSYAVMVFFLMIYLFKIGSFGLRIHQAFFKTLPWKEIIRYTLVMALASIASIGIRNIDTMLIGSCLGLDQVAVYSIAFMIGSIIETPVNALSKIADSKISNAIKENNIDEMRAIYYKSTRFMTIVGGFLFLMICSNIADGLMLLPEKYHGSQLVVYIVGVSAFTNMATGLNSSLINYSSNYIKGTWLLLGVIVLAIVLNLLLIPSIGIYGAAIGTSVALLFYNLMKYLIIYKKYQFQPFGSYIFKVIVLVTVLFIAGINFHFFENLYLNMGLRSVALLILFLLLFRLLKIDDTLWNEIKTFRWKAS